MNPSTTSGETSKAWDHPWNTEEMRENRVEWSLAGDAGLLKHLQQFSQNLTEKVKDTQNTLDSLTSQLNETTVLIDNVTNASLSLANTQFIESRVRDDEADLEQQKTKTDIKTEQETSTRELTEAEMIAFVSQNIQKGMQIMEEKFERVEVLASDSEDEADNSAPSFILKPKDPYKNRPLPYVIGTEKWKASSKIGIESSSSSESEEAFDDDEEDTGDDDEEDEEVKVTESIFNSTRNPMLIRPRPSSPSSSSIASSTSYDRKSCNINKHLSDRSSTVDKMYTRSQDTLNSTSEITTPINDVSETKSGNVYAGKAVGSFAEELSKKLGNVAPGGRSSIYVEKETHSPSINRSDDDLFNNSDDKDEDASSNLFDNNLFNDEVSNSLWNNNSFKRPQSNIIPASMDVPPPIHSIDTKPKSSIDDLFGDIDSEDSDDLFSPKISTKSASVVKQTEADISSHLAKNKLIIPENINEIKTSTPEIKPVQSSTTNLFDDDEDDDDDNLFSPIRRTSQKTAGPPMKHKMQPPGMPISPSDLLTSSLGSKLFQRTATVSSESSENEDEGALFQRDKKNKSTLASTSTSTAATSTTATTAETAAAAAVDASNGGSDVNENNSSSTSGSRSISRADGSGLIVGNRNQGESGNSSGIAIRPQSISSTLSGFGLEPPEMESTRLLSEERTRSRVTSDSLLNPHHTSYRQPENLANYTSNSASIAEHENSSTTTSAAAATAETSTTSATAAALSSSSIPHYDDNLFDDDVFSPPPLPKINDGSISKSKSKVNSLFDDSDSGDDLFSNTSSGSRSQKSTTNHQYATKPSTNSNVDLNSRLNVDDINDIFANSSVPVVDIFASRSDQNLANPIKDTKTIKNSLFDDDSDDDDDDLFGIKAYKKSETSRKSDIMLKQESDDDDLFSNATKSKTDGVKAEKGNEKKKEEKQKKKKEEEEEEEEMEDSKRMLLAKSASSNVSAASGLVNIVNDYSSERKLFKRVDDDDVVVDVNDADDDGSDDDDSLFSTNKVTDVVPKISVGGVNSKEASVKIIKEGKKTNELPEKIAEVGAEKKGKKEKKAEEVSPQLNVKQKSEMKSEEEDNKSTVDGGKISKMESNVIDRDNSITKKPPTSLKIRLPATNIAASGGAGDDGGGECVGGDNNDDSSAVPRRAVSGKIKDLMGKMGDLKILSPTDTPLSLRKSEKLSDSDNVGDRDSEDGSSISLPSARSPPLTPSESSLKKEAPLSPSIEIESAVSFDTPAQPEQQTVKGSKILQNRARIPAKRRPQSRHARQSALRSSGLDFDTSESTVDSITDTSDSKNTRLTAAPTGDQDGVATLKNRPTLNLTTDDRSEISLSKEGSISATKNTTLLSPSTDEEDLFDVPPDLPEDPPKEDGLFGRAPILSPVQARKHQETVRSSENNKNISEKEEKPREKPEKPDKNREKTIDETDKPTDPLRDGNHDPLKDPSQLFAFVTKTPSPEKGQTLLIDEDDSLFSKTLKKNSATAEGLKKTLDLFDDDSESNLFSGPFTKSVKKPDKNHKNRLFNDLDDDEDDENDDLFGSISRKKNPQSKIKDSETQKVHEDAQNLPEKTPDGDNDDDDEDLFFDASEKPTSDVDKDELLFVSPSKPSKQPKTKLEDIFADHSSGDDDFFSTKKPLKSVMSSGSFFSADDDDAGDLFAVKASQQSSSSNQMGINDAAKDGAMRVTSVTKDLKKTAEKIIKDPLSMIDDD